MGESPTSPNARVLSSDLRVELEGRFRAGFFSFASEDLEKYGQDWSALLRPNPGAVAFPRTTAEVSDLLRFCHERGLAVVPSGGRTGLSGGAVAAHGEIVLSLERMNRIGTLDPRALTLEVEAGAITEAVHAAARSHGLTWPVDFASKGSSQVGGNLATNAGGVRVIRYGLTRNWVLGLTVVLADGRVLELNGALEKNNTGVDLRQLFVGSEGTLGVITEAVLKLCPLPVDARTRVCFFAVRDFSSVLSLFHLARRGPFTISAFECLSDPCLREVEAFGLRSPFSDLAERAGAYVLLEVEERDPDSMEAWLAEALALRSGSVDLVLDATMGQSPRMSGELWALRERVAEAILHRSPADGRSGVVHQQDLSVPIASLVDFFSDIEERYAKAYPEFEVFVFGHIGDGNLHIFIRKPVEMPEEEFHAKCAASDTMLFELCAKFSGSVSAEHGVGLLKKPALRYSRSPAELAYFRELKRAFDPKGILNPGKIF